MTILSIRVLQSRQSESAIVIASDVPRRCFVDSSQLEWVYTVFKSRLESVIRTYYSNRSPRLEFIGFESWTRVSDSNLESDFSPDSNLGLGSGLECGVLKLKLIGSRVYESKEILSDSNEAALGTSLVIAELSRRYSD